MFVERITLPRGEWEEWTGRLRLLTEPPAALVASFAWRSEDDTITSINVWDSASDIADFFLERAQPVVEAGGPPSRKPERLGEAVSAYVRPGDATPG
ncbi:MAG TPA: hypothetical protein VKB57_12310 [Acidimicrobiales bacterium]|nr:hypothetical protein [Acidimicrobiales bacterium]